MTLSTGIVMNRVTFTAKAGKAYVAAAAALALASLALIPQNPELHGDIIVYVALPLLVSGAFLHILPSYAKKAPHPILSLAALLLAPAALISPRLYLALHSAAMLAAIAQAASKGGFPYQRALAASSYLSTLGVSLMPPGEPELAALYALTAGMIYAVNSTALTHTYGLKPRGRAASLLALLHALFPASTFLGPAPLRVHAAAEWLLYAYAVRFDAAPHWLRKAGSFKGRAKPVHLNLVYSSIAAVALFPAWLPLTGAAAIHAYAFGFLALNVAAHGPVLLPLAMRIKARPPTPLLPLLLASAAALKPPAALGLVPRAAPCLLFLAGAALLAYHSFIPEGRGAQR